MLKSPAVLCAFCVPIAAQTNFVGAASSSFSTCAANRPAPTKQFCAAPATRVFAASRVRAQSSSSAASTGTDTVGKMATSQPFRKWKLYVIPSSQFSAKALLALDAQGVPYECIHVNVIRCVSCSSGLCRCNAFGRPAAVLRHWI